MKAVFLYKSYQLQIYTILWPGSKSCIPSTTLWINGSYWQPGQETWSLCRKSTAILWGTHEGQRGNKK